MGTTRMWMGVVDPSATAADPFPEALSGTGPAVCISLDDLPPATGADPVGTMDSSHEWNVAKFRKTLLCDADGNQFYAWVLMTEPMAASGF